MAKKSYGDQNGKNAPTTALSKFRAARDVGKSGDGRADYRTATPGWVMAAIIAVAEAGGAIQFGYSRDGGVYTIVILMDGDIEKNYVKQSEGIDNWCEQLVSALTS